MKNACVIFNDGNGVPERVIGALFASLRAHGFVFEEERRLFTLDSAKLSATLSELKKTYENVFVFTGKAYLLSVKETLIKSACVQENVFQGTLLGAGIFTDKKSSVFLLSADFSETGKEYLDGVCVPYLERKVGVKTDRTVIRLVGASEARVQALFSQAKSIDNGQIRYFHTRRFDEDVIEMLYDENVSKRLESDVLRVFAEGLSDHVYALDDTPLEEQLVRLLKLRGKKISVAESFTGGGIARKIVSVSGASAVYFEGLNTYNEESKMRRLGVREYTLRSYGAVSDQTAYEMSAGLMASGNCDISIATTGLAGPKSDSSALPVGLCYIAVGTQEKVLVYRYKFDGDREEITEKAIRYALFLAYKELKNM